MPMTLADTYEQFLADAADLRQLRPTTIRAYRYELAAASRDARFQRALDTVTLTLLEPWLARPPDAPSTISRRTAAFTRFFTWAVVHHYCTTNPLFHRTPTKQAHRLPHPIRTLT